MEPVAKLSNIYVIKALSITRCAYTICFSPSEIDIRGRSASILDSSSDGTGTGLRTGIYIGNVHEDSVFPVIFLHRECGSEALGTRRAFELFLGTG